MALARGRQANPVSRFSRTVKSGKIIAPLRHVADAHLRQPVRGKHWHRPDRPANNRRPSA
jgi:hypothetical protein